MIGIGLGWLFMSDSEHSDSTFDTEYDQSYRSTAEQSSSAGGLKQVRRQASEMVHTAESKAVGVATSIQEKAEEVVDSVQSKAEEMVDQVRGQANNIRYQTRARTRTSSQTLMHMIEDNPLTAGAVALAAGVLVGFSLPITHQEEEWLGPTRDRLVDRAQQQWSDTVEQVKDRVAEVGQGVEEALQETSASEEGTERSKGAQQSGMTQRNIQEEASPSSFATYAETCRRHHQDTYSASGRPYTDYEPAYRYGHELATSPQNWNRSWEDIKSASQREWNQRNKGAWVDMEGAIRYAWEQARQRNRPHYTGASRAES
jgi:ElaB/YqjD/DUF883 family membrane-anchored ribosome-binding protein